VLVRHLARLPNHIDEQHRAVGAREGNDLLHVAAPRLVVYGSEPRWRKLSTSQPEQRAHVRARIVDRAAAPLGRIERLPRRVFNRQVEKGQKRRTRGPQRLIQA
jgi:hypothetical protein